MWGFTPSQPLQLYQSEFRKGNKPKNPSGGGGRGGGGVGKPLGLFSHCSFY